MRGPMNRLVDLAAGALSDPVSTGLVRPVKSWRDLSGTAGLRVGSRTVAGPVGVSVEHVGAEGGQAGSCGETEVAALPQRSLHLLLGT